MRLLFANGEHPEVALPEGVTVLGAAPGANVTLTQDGIAPRHAEIECHGVRAQLRPCAEPVRLNGSSVYAPILIKPGDTLELATVRVRVLADAARAEAAVADRSTRARQAIPKFVLRGVSGPTFGRSFGVSGPMLAGRQDDCDLCIPLGEISRHHARLVPAADGVDVEDLNSANGTFINRKRVRSGTLHPGDELAFDTVRFMLLAPGTDVPPSRKGGDWMHNKWLRIGIAAVVAIVLLLLIARAAFGW